VRGINSTAVCGFDDCCLGFDGTAVCVWLRLVLVAPLWVALMAAACGNSIVCGFGVFDGFDGFDGFGGFVGAIVCRFDNNIVCGFEAGSEAGLSSARRMPC
jgi:hypothetical protein